MEGRFTYEKVVEKMAHMPAELFRIDRRGYIRSGYYADIVLIDPEQTWTCLLYTSIIDNGQR